MLHRALSTLSRRPFSTSPLRLQQPSPANKPVGAFRGSIIGFLLGSTIAGAGVYYYILQEYRVSNTLLSDDIYKLQDAVQRVEGYTRELEKRIGGGGGK